MQAYKEKKIAVSSSFCSKKRDLNLIRRPNSTCQHCCTRQREGPIPPNSYLVSISFRVARTAPTRLGCLMRSLQWPFGALGSHSHLQGRHVVRLEIAIRCAASDSQRTVHILLSDLLGFIHWSSYWSIGCPFRDSFISWSSSRTRSY
jgi:hypothetical protein